MAPAAIFSSMRPSPGGKRHRPHVAVDSVMSALACSARGGEASAMVLLWWWVGIGITAVISVLGAASLWWLVPKWQMRSVTGGTPKDRADIEDNFRKTIGQALGGIAVLI